VCVCMHILLVISFLLVHCSYTFGLFVRLCFPPHFRRQFFTPFFMFGCCSCSIYSVFWCFMSYFVSWFAPFFVRTSWQPFFVICAHICLFGCMVFCRTRLTELLFDAYESWRRFLGPCSVPFVSFFWFALSCSVAFWYAYCLFFCQFHQPPPSVWPAGPLNMLLPILLLAFLLLRPLVVHVMVVFSHIDIGNLYICKHSGYSANRFLHSHFYSIVYN
jgi:hypothetical protein